MGPKSSYCLDWSLLAGGTSAVPAHPVLPEQILPAAKGSKNSPGSPLHHSGSAPAPPVLVLGGKLCPMQLWGRSLVLAGGMDISCPLLGMACHLPATREQLVAST